MKNIVLFFFLLNPFYLRSAQPNIKRVAIIGGGMAGVSTAAFLKNSKFEVHLFEKENRLGGNARSIPLPGANNQEVIVDVGPQYFSKDGWELYIDLLKYFKLYDENQLRKFNINFSVFKKDQELPDFITPDNSGPAFEWIFDKDHGLGRLFSMLTFVGEANKFHKKKTPENITVREFFKRSKVKKQYLNEIIKPIICTTVNSSMANVLDSAMISVGGFLAYEGIIPSSEFLVPKNGMQDYIEKVAIESKKKWNDFHVHLSSPVDKVIKKSDGTFKIYYQNGKVLNADYVVFATQAPAAGKILRDWDAFDGIWEDFTYTYTRVVIHNDRSYLHPIFNSFYNLVVREDGEYYLAMNLKNMSADFGDLIKSWNLTDEEYYDLKNNGHILAESYFDHPRTTPRFIAGVKELNRVAKGQGNMFFAGGWTLFVETQDNAILSGYLAAKKIDPKIVPYWKKKLPSLKKIN
jgi:uncharacterized protein